jgi:hypothetical protein
MNKDIPERIKLARQIVVPHNDAWALETDLHVMLKLFAACAEAPAHKAQIYGFDLLEGLEHVKIGDTKTPLDRRPVAVSYFALVEGRYQVIISVLYEEKGEGTTYEDRIKFQITDLSDEVDPLASARQTYYRNVVATCRSFALNPFYSIHPGLCGEELKVFFKTLSASICEAVSERAEDEGKGYL